MEQNIDPYKYDQLIFNNGAKVVFSINTAEPLGHPSGKALNPDTLLHTIHKNPLQEHCRPTQEGHKLQKKTLGNSFVDQGQPRLS